MLVKQMSIEVLKLSQSQWCTGGTTYFLGAQPKSSRIHVHVSGQLVVNFELCSSKLIFISRYRL